MKTSELFCNTFKALHHQLGHDRPKDMRPFWQQRLSTASAFCQAQKSAKIDIADLLFPNL